MAIRNVINLTIWIKIYIIKKISFLEIEATSKKPFALSLVSDFEYIFPIKIDSYQNIDDFFLELDTFL